MQVIDPNSRYRFNKLINESIEVVESVMLRGNLYRTVVAV